MSLRPDCHPTKTLNLAPIVMNTSAFADDTIWIANSKHSLQSIIDLSSSFFTLNDIKINGNKSELLTFNVRAPLENKSIRMGHDHHLIKAVNRTTTVRFLGIWLKESKGPTHMLVMGLRTCTDLADAMRNKSCTAGHLTYVNNHVLLPKLQYISSTICLSEIQCNKLQRPISFLTKRKCTLPLTTSQDVMHHEGFLGLKSFFHFHTEATISDFIKRLNST